LPPRKEFQLFNVNKDGLPFEFSSEAASFSARLVASNAVLQSIRLPLDAGLVVRMMSDGSMDLGVLNGGTISLALSGNVDRIAADGSRTPIAVEERALVLEITAAQRNSPARLVLPPIGEPIAF